MTYTVSGGALNSAQPQQPVVIISKCNSTSSSIVIITIITCGSNIIHNCKTFAQNDVSCVILCR